MPSFEFVAILVGILLLAFVFFWLIKEGFQDTPENRKRLSESSYTMESECALRETCSACLEPAREITATRAEDCESKGGLVVKNKDGTYSKCKRIGTCGWCSGAPEGQKKCVPRTGSGFPVVPINPLRPSEPLFACPIEGANGLPNFIAKKEDCADFQCSSLKNCRDCAQAQKCKWNTKATPAATCEARVQPGNLSTDEQSKVNLDELVVVSQKCPKSECKDIKDCKECATTPNCGYCALTNKCLKLSREPTDTDTTPLEKCEKKTMISGKEDIEVSQPIISPGQCPGEVSEETLQSYSELSDYKPTVGQLSAAQSNLAVGATETEQTVTQNVASTGGAVSEPKKKDTVSAPGVIQPLGSSGYKPFFPAAVEIDQDKPFESYIQMLVRSELASQGVRTNEPFQVGDVVKNTTGYFRKEGAKLAED